MEEQCLGVDMGVDMGLPTSEQAKVWVVDT